MAETDVLGYHRTEDNRNWTVSDCSCCLSLPSCGILCWNIWPVCVKICL